MTANRHTTEQAPGKPLSAPESASTPEVGVSGCSDPLNGPQNGAQPRGPVDWARRYADQRATAAAPDETETLKATIGRVRKLAAELFVEGATRTHRAIGRQILNTLQPPVPDDAEAQVTDGHTSACQSATGIRGLLEHVGIDTTGRDITVAERIVDAAPAHNGGPSIRECADQDAAHFNDKYAGEGQ